MAKKRGYEGQLYYGTAGSTATNQLLNVEDLSYQTEPELIETTVRGLGTSVPVKVEDSVALAATITWSMLLDATDTHLTALIAASRTGAAVALRTKSYSSGLGFDGDCIVQATHEMTLKGQSKVNFTASPTDQAGRTPSLNV